MRVMKIWTGPKNHISEFVYNVTKTLIWDIKEERRNFGITTGKGANLVKFNITLRGYSTRDGPKNRISFFNIYDVDNEFYEKEEGAMYGPGIAD